MYKFILRKIQIFFIICISSLGLFSCQNEITYSIDDVIKEIQIVFFEEEEINRVQNDIELPISLKSYSEVIISWESLNPEVITNEGIVFRQAEDIVVTLIANVKLLSFTKQVVFELTVLGKNELFTYTVNIYFEEFDDNVYELTDFENLSGMHNERIIYNPQSIDGFTLNIELSYLEIELTQDNLIIEVFYRRNTYEIEFFSNSELIANEFVKFDKVYTEFPVLQDDQYDFLGWSINLDNPQVITDITIFTDTMLYAIWKEKSIYDAYYTGVEGLNGLELLAELRVIIKKNVNLRSYGEARDILQITDQDPNNSDKLILVYLGTSVNSQWDSGSTWNREHVWPQSLLNVSVSNSSRNVGSDLQNLKPANPSENSRRGNKYFDEFGITSASYEPRDEVKGDIARILFYMILMYEYLELVNHTPNTYQMAMLNTLIRWHEQDPVDEFEERRNNVIFEYQNNRNPFIDYPEFVKLIWLDNYVNSHAETQRNIFNLSTVTLNSYLRNNSNNINNVLFKNEREETEYEV